MTFYSWVNGRAGEVVVADVPTELEAAQSAVVDFEQRFGIMPCGASLFVWVRPAFVREPDLVFVTCGSDGQRSAHVAVFVHPPRVIH